MSASRPRNVEGGKKLFTSSGNSVAACAGFECVDDGE